MHIILQIAYSWKKRYNTVCTVQLESQVRFWKESDSFSCYSKAREVKKKLNKLGYITCSDQL